MQAPTASSLHFMEAPYLKACATSSLAARLRWGLEARWRSSCSSAGSMASSAALWQSGSTCGAQPREGERHLFLHSRAVWGGLSNNLLCLLCACHGMLCCLGGSHVTTSGSDSGIEEGSARLRTELSTDLLGDRAAIGNSHQLTGYGNAGLRHSRHARTNPPREAAPRASRSASFCSSGSSFSASLQVCEVG